MAARNNRRHSSGGRAAIPRWLELLAKDDPLVYRGLQDILGNYLRAHAARDRNVCLQTFAAVPVPASQWSAKSHDSRRMGSGLLVTHDVCE